MNCYNYLDLSSTKGEVAKWTLGSAVSVLPVMVDTAIVDLEHPGPTIPSTGGLYKTEQVKLFSAL